MLPIGSFINELAASGVRLATGARWSSRSSFAVWEDPTYVIDIIKRRAIRHLYTVFVFIVFDPEEYVKGYYSTACVQNKPKDPPAIDSRFEIRDSRF
jgi:hypothetical protein